MQQRPIRTMAENIVMDGCIPLFLSENASPKQMQRGLIERIRPKVSSIVLRYKYKKPKDWEKRIAPKDSRKRFV